MFHGNAQFAEIQKTYAQFVRRQIAEFRFEFDKKFLK